MLRLARPRLTAILMFGSIFKFYAPPEPPAPSSLINDNTQPRKRGRPKGSKNRSKEVDAAQNASDTTRLGALLRAASSIPSKKRRPGDTGDRGGMVDQDAESHEDSSTLVRVTV